MACVRARRVLRDQRAMHWQEASRGSGSFRTCPDSRLGCDPSWALPMGAAGLGRAEEAGARRGGCRACSGRVAASLASCWGPGCRTAASFPCLQHPDKVLEAGFSSPLAPLGFLLPCVLLLLVFPSRAAALLLTLSASPGAARCWSALVLPVPKPKPSPPVSARTWEPLLWSCLSSTSPSTLFCLKHFNVMGQQLRGCPNPFLKALSTFREEGRNSGLVMVSTLRHGLCVEAAGLANLAEVSRARLCPALTLLPSTDHYN